MCKVVFLGHGEMIESHKNQVLEALSSSKSIFEISKTILGELCKDYE
jgi:hypothetical protein